jgi:hypothetical protein
MGAARRMIPWVAASVRTNRCPIFVSDHRSRTNEGSIVNCRDFVEKVHALTGGRCSTGVIFRCCRNISSDRAMTSSHRRLLLGGARPEAPRLVVNLEKQGTIVQAGKRDRKWTTVLNTDADSFACCRRASCILSPTVCQSSRRRRQEHLCRPCRGKSGWPDGKDCK